ncbi:MAG: amidohydrolase family protein, partial [Isosphaeraceae bacterium]
RHVPEARALLVDQAEFTLDSYRSRIEGLRQGTGIGGGAMTVGYGLWALQVAGHPPDETTDAMVDFLLKTQRPDGHWPSGTNRPPLEESALTATTLGALGLEWYCRDDSRRKAAREAIARAGQWIAKAPVKVQEDRNSKLWGLSSIPDQVDGEALGKFRQEILATQRDDGGWPSRDDLPSDAYATGQTLVRLLDSQGGSDEPAIRKGIAYLLKTQLEDGSWKVETRSKPIQVMFDNGDPHGKHQFISTPATAWAVVALARVLTADDSRNYDLVIRNGRVVDGSGNPWFLGDVAIRGDRIVAVGGKIEGGRDREIDAKGLIVAPGFIDMHSHSDRPLLEDGAALSKLHQGVTTEILGEDSSGGPAKGEVPEATFKKGDRTLRWSTLGGYFDAVESSGVAVNVASYVGLGTLLDCVLGDDLSRPNAERLKEIKGLLEEAMRDGALGLSTMVAGARELNLTTDDLVELAKVVQVHGGIYSSHIRNEGTGVFDAVKEAIAVGERSGAPVDIIHLKIADQTYWNRMDEIVALIDAARARGVNVQANVYPYTRGNNDLVSIVPPWAHEGGTDALVARLRDPGQRDRLKREIREGPPGWYNHYTAVGGDWSRMLVSARLTPPNAKFQGRTMDVILAEKAKAAPDRDPIDLMLDFLAEENGSVSTIYAHHTEADMNLALIQPWCSIGSDGSALAVEGSLRRGHPHPRNFGTFPRVLGVYVRQRGVLTLEDAVRKMTSLNAAKIGIKDRGLLRAGLFADVTIFDPAKIIDRSTYLEPFQYSEGVTHVIVNGKVVLDGGEPTDARPGRALRHGQAELPYVE